jgi:hypothetical protein
VRVIEFRFRFLPAVLEEVEEVSAAAVLTPCVKLPLIVTAIDKARRQMREPPAQPCRQRAVSLEVAVGDMGGLANVGETGVGG